MGIVENPPAGFDVTGGLPRKRAGALLGPHATPAQCGDDVLLIAAGMPAYEHLAVICVADRQARRAVILCWALCEPTSARFRSTQRIGDALSIEAMNVHLH